MSQAGATVSKFHPESCSLLLSTIVLCCSLLISASWYFRLDILKAPVTREMEVALSTALCFAISSAAVLLFQQSRRFLACILSGLSSLICISIFSHYLFNSFDTDSFLLVTFAGESPGPLGPGRMSPTILISFLLLNMALVLPRKSLQPLKSLLISFACALCITAYTAHLFQLPSLMKVSTLIQMSFPTALLGLSLGFALLLLFPDHGLMKVLASPGPGGRFARRMLPLAIIVPFLTGKIVLFLEATQHYSENLGMALAVLISFCFLLPMVTSIASWLDESDRQKEQARSEKEASLLNKRLIIDSAAEAFIMIERQGKIVEWNQAAEKMFGWSKEEVKGRSFDFILAEEERDYRLQRFESYLQNNDLSDINKSLELQMKRKDGSVFPAEGTPFELVSGKQVCLCCFLQDISDRKESERRINEFVSTVSHELRTPLTSIKGALRLIEGGLAGEIAREGMMLVGIASSETERLIRIVNDILDLKKIEAGKLVLNCQDVELATIAETSLEGLSGMASEFGIQLRLDSGADGMINCDRDRIIQVLANLLSNAIKFSPQNETVDLKIQASSEKTVRFSVIDNGCGIDENHAEQLFERFHQIDSSDTRAQGGTGLGLAISKAIIEQHQGRIGFESQLGKGSTFWFELPAKSISERKELQNHRIND